jgi:DNA (cytosine-5)-methyltransferase 1
MKAISLFSGVGGLDLGFERAGIETVLQAEQEPWALEVLARHWPETERVTDVRDVGDGYLQQLRVARSGTDTERWGERSDIDLIYGGFPCQDVSMAGKRAGLDGARSGLWFEFRRIVSELRPRWVVIENVPGLLSSNGGADFAVILNGLEELGFWWAYGVLDSQHFGVPQRRRRVFVVASPSRRSAEQVLSLCESCGGHSKTGGATGEDVAATLRGRSYGAGVNLPGRGGEEAYTDNLIAPTLPSSLGKGGLGHNKDEFIIAPTVTENWSRTGGPAGDEGRNMIVAGTLQSEMYHHGGIPNQTVNGDNGHLQVSSNGVRRLTPLECERLQGFPDDWTRWTADGREIADSHRYRMMGNAVTVPVAQWIGHRLVAADFMLREPRYPEGIARASRWQGEE